MQNLLFRNGRILNMTKAKRQPRATPSAQRLLAPRGRRPLLPACHEQIRKGSPLLPLPSLPHPTGKQKREKSREGTECVTTQNQCCCICNQGTPVSTLRLELQSVHTGESRTDCPSEPRARWGPQDVTPAEPSACCGPPPATFCSYFSLL